MSGASRRVGTLAPVWRRLHTTLRISLKTRNAAQIVDLWSSFTSPLVPQLSKMVHQAQVCVLLLTLLLGARKVVCSIQCYSCSSSENPDCQKPRKDLIPLKNCSLPELETTQRFAEDLDDSFRKIFHLDIHNHEPLVPLNCLKLTTKIGTKTVIVRGCQLAATENMSVCGKLEKIGKDQVKIEYCSLCNRDGCNSGRIMHPAFTIIAFFVGFVMIIEEALL